MRCRRGASRTARTAREHEPQAMRVASRRRGVAVLRVKTQLHLKRQIEIRVVAPQAGPRRNPECPLPIDTAVAQGALDGACDGQGIARAATGRAQGRHGVDQVRAHRGVRRGQALAGLSGEPLSMMASQHERQAEPE